MSTTKTVFTLHIFFLNSRLELIFHIIRVLATEILSPSPNSITANEDFITTSEKQGFGQIKGKEFYTTIDFFLYNCSVPLNHYSR